MKNNFQKLVLLEFMVNKVEFYERDSKIDRTYLSRLGHTKVQIRLKTCCQLDVLEDENSKRYIDEKTGSSIVEFGSGKSCLLPSALLMNGQNNQACICVSRKAPEGDMKDYFTLGETRIDLCTLFKALIKSNSCSPAVKSQRGEYDLRDGQDAQVGSVDVFIRATDLGKNIVTMFQMGAGESSFYFKGTDPGPIEEDDEGSAPCFVCPESSAPVMAEKWLSPRQGYASGFPQPPPYGYGQFGGFPPQNMYQPQYKEGVTFNQPQSQARPCSGRAKPVMIGRGAGGGGGGGGGGMPAQSGFAPSGFPQPGAPCPQMAGVAGGGGGGGYAGGYAGGYGQQQMVPYRDEDFEKLDGDYKEIAAEVNGYEVKIKLLRRPKKPKE